MATPKQHPAVEAVRKSGANKVKVACSDIDGILRGKYLHKDKFFGAAEPHPKGGFGFCDVVFGWDSGTSATTTPRSPAGSTASRTRWRGSTWTPRATCRGTATCRSSSASSSTPTAARSRCARARRLKRVLKRAEKLGVLPMAGMEFEWFNFAETPQSWAAKKGVGPQNLTPGMFGYSLLRMADNRDFFNALMDEMLAFGVPIEGLHTETGPGTYEVAITFSEALEAADRAILFKTGAKEIGKRFGIMPSFMAKWSQQCCPAAAGHIHQSLSDGKTNLFYDAKSSRAMSKLFESYLAGQVACLMEFAPMFWPTINSYKRLVDGFWAPVKPTWGLDNRTASFRVIAGSPKATRLETRCPGADVNPYLAMAAVIAAGLHGVEKGLKLTDAADHRHQPGRRGHPARAALADPQHAELQAVEHRPRLARRHLRRPLRRHARVGAPPVAGRGDRLGVEALPRDHLTPFLRAEGRHRPSATSERSCRHSDHALPTTPSADRHLCTHLFPGGPVLTAAASGRRRCTTWSSRSRTGCWRQRDGGDDPGGRRAEHRHPRRPPPDDYAARSTGCCCRAATTSRPRPMARSRCIADWPATACATATRST